MSLQSLSGYVLFYEKSALQGSGSKLSKKITKILPLKKYSNDNSKFIFDTIL